LSIVLAVQPFLMPAATSSRLWASGNNATCTFLGTVNQMCISVILYNGMLSYYYLLSIRFGVTARTFARRFEPWMHAVAIGYPLITSIVGASMNMYSEAALWTGCTVVDYPRGCNQENGECKTELIFWIFGGALLSFVMLSLVLINFVIFWHVRQRNRRVRRSSLASERQAQRTNEVAVQAFLYVAAFWATFVWIFTLKILDSLSFDALDSHTFYPLMVLHSLFMPSAGLFNLCIYLRPRYLKTRADYPAETRIWAVRRALYGESVSPCQNDGMPENGEPSSTTLGAFRVGSLRKLFHGSASVPITLENAHHSCPSSTLDPSSSSFGHYQESCHITEGHVETEIKTPSELR
jgi:Serpentine type 7TM GPCR chemoreceptor Srv